MRQGGHPNRCRAIYVLPRILNSRRSRRIASRFTRGCHAGASMTAHASHAMKSPALRPEVRRALRGPCDVIPAQCWFSTTVLIQLQPIGLTMMLMTFTFNERLLSMSDYFR